MPQPRGADHPGAGRGAARLGWGCDTESRPRRARDRSPREVATIALLAGDGVVVREGGSNQKLALAGDTAWIGSGNATGASGRNAGQLEWGLRTRNATLVGAVASALARDLR